MVGPRDVEHAGRAGLTVGLGRSRLSRGGTGWPTSSMMPIESEPLVRAATSVGVTMSGWLSSIETAESVAGALRSEAKILV